MKWTNEEIKELKEMYLKKMSVSEIAVVLGKTHKTIRNKAYALEITWRVKYTEEEKQYVRDNYKSYNLREVADYLGKDKTNICRLAKELGLDRTKRKAENPKTYCDENGVSHEVGWIRKKSGRRADLNNTFFRSSWEANMARYYNYIGVKWQFEPKMFIFNTIRRGSVSYTPDFYLPEEDRWVEVK